MTDHKWHDLWQQGVDLFGETPRPEYEQQLLEAFQRSPGYVHRQLEHVAKAVSKGDVTYGWAALAKRIQTAPRGDVTVTDDKDRDRAIRAAEHWIRNAGLHYDREPEVLDELFGHFGPLRAWANDQTLRDRIARLWAEQRPDGEALEHDQQRRADAYRARQRQIAERKEPTA